MGDFWCMIWFIRVSRVILKQLGEISTWYEELVIDLVFIDIDVYSRYDDGGIRLCLAALNPMRS